MTYKKGHTKINTFDRMAPVVLFLSSYMPLFGIIIIRQILANSEHLVWGGLHRSLPDSRLLRHAW